MQSVHRFEHLIKLFHSKPSWKMTENERRIFNRCVNAANYLPWNCLAENCWEIIAGCLKYQAAVSVNIYTSMSWWGLNSESAWRWNRINIWSVWYLIICLSACFWLCHFSEWAFHDSTPPSASYVQYIWMRYYLTGRCMRLKERACGEYGYAEHYSRTW